MDRMNKRGAITKVENYCKQKKYGLGYGEIESIGLLIFSANKLDKVSESGIHKTVDAYVNGKIEEYVNKISSLI